MTNLTEPSSFSSLLSNGSNSRTLPPIPITSPAPSPPPAPSVGTNLDVVILSKLSSNLETLLLNGEFDCTDAEIVVEGSPVGVHRCILSARSQFFYDLFAKGGGRGTEGRKPCYLMDELVPEGKVGKEAFLVFLNYLYSGKLKSAPKDVCECVDRLCAHDSCRPAIDFPVELLYASSVFRVSELVNLLERLLLNFVEKALVEDVIPILQVAFHSKLNPLLDRCIQRVVRSDLDDISLDKELPTEVASEIRSVRCKSELESTAVLDTVHSKGIRRIHRALDLDDVELVKLLLSESSVTLDDAYALHYAAGYCDSKVMSELLDLELANINLKNDRGYTPLHIAALRREPSIIVSLLNKAASVLEVTEDGHNAVTICRRLTRTKDYNARTKQGEQSNKNRLCIEILEREMMRNPISMEDSVTSPLLADDLHMKLLHLENRVAFAKLLFPAEANVAMEIAQADTTSEFSGLCASRSADNLKEVDLNETPTMQNKRIRARVDALTRTVELGRRYFPHCSHVLDKFLKDDLSDLFYLQKGSPDEQEIKRMRFCELKEDVRKAFSKDKAESTRTISSSSSSPPKRYRKSIKTTSK